MRYDFYITWLLLKLLELREYWIDQYVTQTTDVFMSVYFGFLLYDFVWKWLTFCNKN